MSGRSQDEKRDGNLMGGLIIPSLNIGLPSHFIEPFESVEDGDAVVLATATSADILGESPAYHLGKPHFKAFTWPC